MNISNLDVNKIADIFNEIFDLELRWGIHSEGSKIDAIKLSDLETLSKLIRELKPLLESSEIQNAIWTLTQNKGIIRLAVLNSVLMQEFGLTKDETQVVQAGLLSNQYFSIYHDKLAEILRRHKIAHKEHEVVGYPSATYNELHTVWANFLEVEERILKDSGLNQASAAIIMQRMREYEDQILKNLLSSKSVLTGKYIRSINTMVNLSNRLGEWARSHIDAGDRRAILTNAKNLVKTKDKIIGLATLWADSVPLITFRDWGVASVLSSAAGATIAAILPSGENK